MSFDAAVVGGHLFNESFSTTAIALRGRGSGPVTRRYHLFHDWCLSAIPLDPLLGHNRTLVPPGHTFRHQRQTRPLVDVPGIPHLGQRHPPIQLQPTEPRLSKLLRGALHDQIAHELTAMRIRVHFLHHRGIQNAIRREGRSSRLIAAGTQVAHGKGEAPFVVEAVSRSRRGYHGMSANVEKDFGVVDGLSGVVSVRFLVGASDEEDVVRVSFSETSFDDDSRGVGCDDDSAVVVVATVVGTCHSRCRCPAYAGAIGAQFGRSAGKDDVSPGADCGRGIADGIFGGVHCPIVLLVSWNQLEDRNRYL
mmetsp:Transcript_287/g.574  ORF Transcript_287/g.574 Transcript_287/m.574 type:complete len:307 (+) Transcript_287:132-1052(+)